MKSRVSAKEEKARMPATAAATFSRSINHAKYPRLFFIAWFIFFLAGCAGEKKPHLYRAGEVKSETLTLPNGLTCIFQENHAYPVVAFEIGIMASLPREGKFLGSGISHFLEHLIFKGTAKYGPGEIEEAIRRLGGEINGATSLDHTLYRTQVPAANAEKALAILAEMLKTPLFDPKEVEREKEVVLREIDLINDDAPRALVEKFWQEAYPSHPYHYQIIGKRELFLKLTREDLISYYQKTYVANNMVLAVVGDFQTQKMRQVLEKYLQDFPAGNLDPLVMPQKTHWWQAKRIEERKAVNLVYFLIGFPSVDILSDDLHALDLLAEILGGGSSSYLDKKLRVEKGLVFSIDASNRTPLYPGVLMISANLDIKKYDVFVPELLRELEAVKNGALSEEDLDKAKKQFLAGYFASRQTVGGVAADLVSGKLYTGEADFNQRYIEEIKKVGLKQIKQAARKYIDLQKLLLVSFLPQAAQKGQRAQAPDLTSLNQEPEKVSVSESLTAVVKEDHRLPLVNIHAVFLGGLRAEDEKTNGLTNFMSRMLIKGTKRRSGIEIEEALEKVGGAINAYCGQNSFGISINVMRDDLDLALDILYDILFNSLFPPAQIEKVRERILAEINAQDDDIFSTAGKLLKSELYRVHPYGMPLEGRQETVGKFSRRDLIAFYQRYVRANKMVISVFGDVQKKQVFPKIKRKFIRLAKTKPLPIQTRPEPKLDSLRSKTKQLPNKEQLLLMWGFPAVDLKSPDRYAMDVLKVILGGQSSRMFQEIREKQGLAYTLGAFQSLGIDPGYLGLYVSTSLGKLTLVEDELAKQIKRLREELVSDTELNDCKSYLKGQYILHLQDTSAFGERVALDELYGLGYADYKNEVGRIEAVTKEDIQRVSRLYLDLAAFAQAVVEPSKKDAPEKNKNQSSLEKNILKR